MTDAVPVTNASGKAIGHVTNSRIEEDDTYIRVVADLVIDDKEAWRKIHEENEDET